MTEFITTLLLGIVICVLGAVNMTGNISTLHSYHRHRVTEEDRKPFGRLVGLGTVIIGVSLIIFSVLYLVSLKTANVVLVTIGTVEIIAGAVVGLAISFYAMIKYNKGIF